MDQEEDRKGNSGLRGINSPSAGKKQQPGRKPSVSKNNVCTQFSRVTLKASVVSCFEVASRCVSLADLELAR